MSFLAWIFPQMRAENKATHSNENGFVVSEVTIPFDYVRSGVCLQLYTIALILSINQLIRFYDQAFVLL
jgi:hypothetical protein